MILKNLLLTVAAIAYCTNCFSQGGTCGSYISNAQNTLEKTFTITPLISTQSLPQVNKDLSLAIYVVKDSNNNAGVTQTDIDAALNKLNSYFSPISLKFHQCFLIYIDNYQFDHLVQEKNEKDMTNLYFKPNMINLYLVSEIVDRFKNLVKGFTYMPADNKNFIFIRKFDFNSSEIGHQFGHFFNLYHTHENFFGNELVENSATCATTGDLCCDTQADPKLSGAVDGNCIYSGKIKDSNNQYYSPSVKNFMSFSNNECRCFFSQTQYLRVVYAINNFKNTLK